MPIRSFLFVPADSERKLARALESGADALILDLEDSVAAANRPTARKLARQFLDAHGAATIARYVRINPLASGLALDDLAATVAGRPDGVLLPKCVPEDVRTLDHYLSAFEAAAGNPVGTTRIIAIATETPQAVFALSAITPAARRGWRRSPGARRICRLASAAITAPWREFTTARISSPVRCACWRRRRPGSGRSTRSTPISATPTGSRRNAPRRDAPGSPGRWRSTRRRSRRSTRPFRPAPPSASWAERVIAAFAANPDAGTLALDGKMIDKPHLVLARRLLGLPAA